MRCLLVIPHYNHWATLPDVARACVAYGPVAVFDDGSNPFLRNIPDGVPVTLIHFEKNRGKGVMIKEAARYALQNGFTHILTIDADGQHNPADIAALLAVAQNKPQDLIIGVRQMDKSVPFSSRFGRKFGGFWVHLQTGKPCADIQSGLRVYPAALACQVPTWCARYAFEVEIVVRACWAGFSFTQVPVRVNYPKDRISHFNKLKDNLRLTFLNTYLTLRSMLPIPHRRLAAQADGTLQKTSYWAALKEHLKRPGMASYNACSAAWGIFCGSIALPGIRQVFLFGGAGWWNLNRILVIGFEKLCIGPFIPALCIEVGFFMRYGRFLTEFNFTTLGRQFLSRVWEWFTGSLLVAPLLAGVTFVIVWAVSKFLARRVA